MAEIAAKVKFCGSVAEQGLRAASKFDISRNMESSEITQTGPITVDTITAAHAAEAFAALGSEIRLSILRTLVRAGPGGLPVGAIQDRLGVAASTLSHHLRALTGAGVLVQRREGRVLNCHADYNRIAALAGFLMSECCADQAGATADPTPTQTPAQSPTQSPAQPRSSHD